jgi:hypothetical protein
MRQTGHCDKLLALPPIAAGVHPFTPFSPENRARVPSDPHRLCVLVRRAPWPVREPIQGRLPNAHPFKTSKYGLRIRPIRQRNWAPRLDLGSENAIILHANWIRRQAETMHNRAPWTAAFLPNGLALRIPPRAPMMPFGRPQLDELAQLYAIVTSNKPP